MLCKCTLQLSVFFLCLFNVGEAAAFSKFDVIEKLSLEIKLDRSAQKDDSTIIPLLITLTNKTDKQLEYTVSTNPHPLYVDLRSLKGKTVSLKNAAVTFKNHNNPAKILVIQPCEVIVFERSVDLNNYNVDITNEAAVKLKAGFVLFETKEKAMQYSVLTSEYLVFKLFE